MPLRNLFNDKDSDDIHVVMGHATSELWNRYAAVVSSAGKADFVEEYQNHNNDVQFRFVPNFRGTVTGHVHSGFGATPPPGQPKPPGIQVNLVTGQVLVDQKLADPHPNNFILTLVAKPQPAGAGPELRYLFRIHVHEAYERILTPDKLSIRRQPREARTPVAVFRARALHRRRRRRRDAQPGGPMGTSGRQWPQCR
jgi:hypothetical protein